MCYGSSSVCVVNLHVTGVCSRKLFVWIWEIKGEKKWVIEESTMVLLSQFWERVHFKNLLFFLFTFNSPLSIPLSFDCRIQAFKGGAWAQR